MFSVNDERAELPPQGANGNLIAEVTGFEATLASDKLKTRVKIFKEVKLEGEKTWWLL